VTLNDELTEHGSALSATEFREVLIDVWQTLAPALNMERVLYRPSLALSICGAVRARAGRRLPDEMILRHLNNTRKKGSES
jgi:hypothetical protein